MKRTVRIWYFSYVRRATRFHMKKVPYTSQRFTPPNEKILSPMATAAWFTRRGPPCNANFSVPVILISKSVFRISSDGYRYRIICSHVSRSLNNLSKSYENFQIKVLNLIVFIKKKFALYGHNHQFEGRIQSGYGNKIPYIHIRGPDP